MTQSIRAILDASAVAAFCRGESIGTGEIIAEITDEDARFGLPVPALVVASTELPDRRRLALPLGHPSGVVLADDPDSWQELAQTLLLVDRYDIASAAVMASRYGAYILTRRPGWYAKLSGGGGPIIEV